MRMTQWTRFGDDLTEEILQYLTLEDKVRFECMSKQWQRCVFQRQFSIHIKHYDGHKLMAITESDKPSILKKCPNISKFRIHIEYKSEVLSLFGQYCPNIKSLDIWKTNSEDLEFFQIYGHRLKELSLLEKSIDLKHLLQFCQNLKSVSFSRYSVLFTEDKDFLPKLETIKTFILIKSQDVNQMKIFCDKYKKTMKNIHFYLDELSAKDLKKCIECISSLENLRSLTVSIESERIKEPIDESIALIGRKCTKLLKLNLRIWESVLISHLFLDVFTHFKAIKKLKIKLHYDTVVSGSVECFKHCKQLNGIDIDCIELNDDFFSNFVSILPQLQRLKISTKRFISDSFINSLNSRKSIEKVSLFGFNEPNDTYYKKCWYFGKRLFEVKASPKGKDVIDIGHNCGLVCRKST